MHALNDQPSAGFFNLPRHSFRNWRGLFNRPVKPLPKGMRNLTGILFTPPGQSNPGSTAFHKRAVSMRGLSLGLIPGNAPRSISGGKWKK